MVRIKNARPNQFRLVFNIDPTIWMCRYRNAKLVASAFVVGHLFLPNSLPDEVFRARLPDASGRDSIDPFRLATGGCARDQEGDWLDLS